MHGAVEREFFFGSQVTDGAFGQISQRERPNGDAN